MKTWIYLKGIKYYISSDSDAFKILKWFMKPFLEQAEFPVVENKERTAHEILQQLFGADVRDIRFFKLTKTIEHLKGLYKLRALRFDPYRGPRKFRAGDWYVALVMDERTRSFVDLEFFKNWEDDESFTYRLTKKEFERIVDSLEEIKEFTWRVI